jgi:hypothetical protein
MVVCKHLPEMRAPEQQKRAAVTSARGAASRPEPAKSTRFFDTWGALRFFLQAAARGPFMRVGNDAQAAVMLPISPRRSSLWPS